MAPQAQAQGQAKGNGESQAKAQESTLVDAYAQLEALRAENAALKAKAAQVQPLQRLTLKVGAKGGLSVYGLSRFPVTLYAGQWERLLGEAERIKAFLAANKTTLSQGKAVAE